MTIYLPPSYGADRTRRYPVVYFLHGYGVDDSWFLNGRLANLPDIADRLAAASSFRETIIVLPNAFTLHKGSMYSNSLTTGDWESYVADDLVGYIDAHYRTIANRLGRGLAGHSMGGYGAIRIGMKRPDVFSALYIMAACCLSAQLNPSAEAMAAAAAVKTREEAEENAKQPGFRTAVTLASAAAWSPNPNNPPLFLDLPVKDGAVRPEIVAKWAANAPLAMLDQYVPNLKRYRAIAMDIGTSDTLLSSNVELDRALTALGVRHTYEEYDGDHVNKVAERLEMKVLPFFAASLSFDAPSAPQTTRNVELVEMVTRMAKIGRAGSPTFSPDGTRLAFVSDRTGVPHVWVTTLDGAAPVQVTKGDDPIGRVTWSPKGDWLALSLSPGGGMNTQIYVVRPDGTGLRRLTDGGKETNNLGDWTHNGLGITMGSNRANPAAIDAYFVNPASGERELVSGSKGLQTIEDVSRDGALALVSRLRGRGDNDLYLIDLKTHTEILVTPHDPPGSFFGELAPNGREIYLVSDKDRDKAAFVRVRIEGAGRVSPPEMIVARENAELSAFEINDQGTTAALLWNVAGRNELAFVDLASRQPTAGPKLPGEIAGSLTFSADGRQLAMTVSGATAPPDIWVLDVASGRLRQVTQAAHEGVDLAKLTRPELVTFTAHDGLELSGWLYRPVGRPVPAPFVVSFHGGPEGQERPSFRSDYQALVAQGIGVFAPNVRGSSGFGKRFVNLDNGALRVEGIKDLKDCVDYLVSRRMADPKRVGITGGSYGGYMTMVGVTFYPDLFAAGVNLFGMVNFFTFFEHTEPWMAAISTTEYGDPKTQADLLRDLSPLGKLDRIKTPLMVQHGANDTNVPVVEAEQIVENLKRRNVPVEYILFPDEGHGFRKEKNRITSTVRLVEFFVRHLVDRGPTQ